RRADPRHRQHHRRPAATLPDAPPARPLAQRTLPRSTFRLHLADAAAGLQAPPARYAATARLARRAVAPQAERPPGDGPPPRHRAGRDRGGAVTARGEGYGTAVTELSNDQRGRPA